MGSKVGIEDTPASDARTLAGIAQSQKQRDDTLAGDPRTLPGNDGEREPPGPYTDVPASARIGRFVLLDVLGSGGMGVVHAAYDPELDRKIALKILHSSAGQSSGSRGRLVREAQAMARLSHPNVVTVHDVGEHQGRVFLAMESVEGQTLSTWLAQDERSLREVLDIFVQAGRGLAAAHDKGLVHRDFKPENVMVGDDGRVRVMDFGLARPSTQARGDIEATVEQSTLMSSARSGPVTVAGSVVGTPSYMAPEQWSGAEVDARTDQFSFCVALYEALCGQRPFEGEDLGSLAVSVTTGKPLPPPAALALPCSIMNALERGLATEPEQRWPSMVPLLELLQRDPARARRRFIALAAFAVFFGLAGGGWFLRHSRQIARCDQHAAAVTEVWGADNRQRIHQAFLATGVPYAADTYERLAPVLDHYAHDWTDLRRAVCLDRLDADQRTTQQNTLAAECLDERRQEFQTLVTELERGTSTAVRDGIVAAASLPRISQCVDELALTERADGPSDPQQREAVARVRRTLALSQQRGIVADFEGASRHATASIEQAEAIGWPALQASAQFSLGDAEYHLGHYEEAHDALHRAFTLALASGRDALASQAAEGLAQVWGIQRSRPKEGLLWADIAQASSTRRGRETGDLHRLRGMLLADHGDLRLAEQEMNRAVELDQAEFGPNHPHTAISLQARCNVYSDLGRYDEALACNENALEVQTAFLGPTHPNIAVALNNLGGVHLRMGDYPKGRALLEQALEIRELALGRHHPEVGQSLLNLGAATAMMGDLEAAEPVFVRAVEVLEQAVGPEDPTLAKALTNLAQLQVDTGEVPAAKHSGERALDIQESALGLEHPDLINTLSLLASVHGKLGDLAAAEALHRRELAIAENHVGADPVAAQVTRVNLAQVIAKTGRHEEALILLEPALEALRAKLGNEHPHVASTEHALAEILARKGEASSAVEHARKALAVRERVLGPEHADTVTSRSLLAELQHD
jgi:tetratricopeptide (TPR) repeat protein